MFKTKKLAVSVVVLLFLGVGFLVFSKPASAVHIGTVTSTTTRQFWNIDGNNSFIKQWNTYRELRIVNGYAFTGYSALPTVYKGLVRETSVYYNYRTW